MMLCLAVTLKEPVSESDIHETVVDSRGVSAVFPRQSLPTDPLRLHSTSGPVVDQQPPSSARTPGRPLKVCSVCVEEVCYNYDITRWSESKRTEFLGEFALLADGLRLLNAHPPGHPEIGEDLAEPPDLVRRLVKTLELLRPHFADPARDHERLWQTEFWASALSAYRDFHDAVGRALRISYLESLNSLLVLGELFRGLLALPALCGLLSLCVPGRS